MQHPERDTPVDLHHTIAPRTSRVSPDAAALFAASVPLDIPPLRVLSPPDMVLHSTVHLFNDEVERRRCGICSTCTTCSATSAQRPGFWDELLARARVARHCAGRCTTCFAMSRRVLGTPVPPERRAAAAAGAPGPVVNAVMDRLFAYRFACDPPGKTRAGAGLAIWLLYLRAHWLRMPPLMLVRHLSIKAVRRLRERVRAQARGGRRRRRRGRAAIGVPERVRRRGACPSAANCARSAFLSTLFVVLRGRLSTNSTCRGFL